MYGKITKRVVDAVLPTDRDQFLWDEELRGFGLKVTAKGRKLYLLDYRTKQGRRRRFTLPGAHGAPWTPDSARKEARKLIGDVAHGGDPVEDRMQIRKAETVAELAKRFMEEHVLARRKPLTARDYGRLLDRYILPALGSRKVVDVNRADIARLHHKMRHAPRQANQMIAVMSKMLNLAEAWGLRHDGTNPCRHIERYPENRRDRFLSGEELRQLGVVLSEAERTGLVRVPPTGNYPGKTVPIPGQVAPLVRLLVFTGARLGEILTLRWEYIDHERRVLALPDSKTGAKVIHLNAPSISVLAGLLQVEGNSYVFPGARKGQHFVGIHNPWNAIRQAAGIPEVRLHDLRHSFASVAVAGGMGLPLIGRLLGHTRAETTNRYAHLADDPLKAAAELIGSQIADTMEGKKPSRNNVTDLSTHKSRRKSPQEK